MQLHCAIALQKANPTVGAVTGTDTSILVKNDIYIHIHIFGFKVQEQKLVKILWVRS